MDEYYKKAIDYLHSGKTELAITAFIKGIDNGREDCAYGLLRTVTEEYTATFSEEEAISIFLSFYEKIKEKATQGDAKAMVMIAHAQRLGFVEDDDEPYFYWLEMAAKMGNGQAEDILHEIEEMEEPVIEAPKEDEQGNIIKPPNPCSIDEAGVRVEPNKTMLDTLGITDMIKEQKKNVEVMLSVNGGIDPDKAFDY